MDKTTSYLQSQQTNYLAALSHWARRRARDLAPFVTLVVLVIFFSVTTDSFFNVINLRNILGQIATLAIVSTGITFVLLCAEIDLSIAAVATMTGVISAVLFGEMGMPQIPAVLIGTLAATGIGLLNGWSTTRIGLPSFMATLATMQIASGLGMYITKGSILYTLPPLLAYLGGEYIGETEPWRLPIVILTGVAALIIGHVVLAYTKFGRYVYMTGSNREAARLSGINTRNIVAACLTISAFTAGLTGMLNTGRLGSAQGYGLDAILLDSISAVVLGGTSLFGGEGGIKNTVIGLLILGVLNNGLNQLQMDIFVRLWVRGVILLIALIINVYALRLRNATTE
ncbi:MAG: ABC transporter permease [Anaerolineaceae bacterium]|nr:ABC transporter permease [Anaerolineaceae bacterium]